ncbi:MAG: dTDP-4-dehydrorhamnose reductase [Thermodesulfobacteriota bacterium]|nr:dTDP-4-dehydrorhamnose reductase [Thermodesulfobacteriota bacterium]
MKILLAGANGMLGHEVLGVLESRGHEVIATDIEATDIEATDIERTMIRMDITDSADVNRVLSSVEPLWLVNCAAWTRVDACEDHEDAAFRLNALAPGILASACRDRGIRFLQISSDYVFDGTKADMYVEEDTPNPINAYGRTKLAGEIAVKDRMDDYIIIRPQWLFGPHGPNFVATILDLARDREHIEVVNDQFGSPTYARDLANGIAALMEVNARGVFHVSNRGIASWYDLAKKACELMEFNTRVVPVDSGQFPRPAARPANSTLSTQRFSQATGSLLPPWQISLKAYLRFYIQQKRRL